MPEIKRRRFLRDSALIAAIFSLFSIMLAGMRIIFPAHSRQKQSLKIGKAADYPINSFQLIQDAKIFVYRDHEGVRVVSAVCTHLGCLLEQNENGFQCPCHGSHFDMNGKVQNGPALRSLAWYKVDAAEDGELVVNVAKRVRPNEKCLV